MVAEAEADLNAADRLSPVSGWGRRTRQQTGDQALVMKEVPGGIPMPMQPASTARQSAALRCWKRRFVMVLGAITVLTVCCDASAMA